MNQSSLEFQPSEQQVVTVEKTEERHEVISRYILSATNAEQLHVCYILLDLWKLSKRNPEVSKALTINFDIKARSLGYYEWKRGC